MTCREAYFKTSVAYFANTELRIALPRLYRPAGKKLPDDKVRELFFSPTPRLCPDLMQHVQFVTLDDLLFSRHESGKIVQFIPLRRLTVVFKMPLGAIVIPDNLPKHAPFPRLEHRDLASIINREVWDWTMACKRFTPVANEWELAVSPCYGAEAELAKTALKEVVKLGYRGRATFALGNDRWEGCCCETRVSMRRKTDCIYIRQAPAATLGC